MDAERYRQVQEQKYREHEALCKRCGACCGVMEGDPCEHLRKGSDGRYFCDIYEERFGLHKTIKGEPVLCVPIRNMLDKSWWGRSQCAYKKIIIPVLLAFFLAGCSIISHSEQIGTLLEVSASDRQKELYIKRQTEGFEALKSDIKNNELKVGMGKAAALKEYGEPVVVTEIEDGGNIKEAHLYRYPTDYFPENPEDKVYLYFDGNNKLVKWKRKDF